MHRRRYGHRRGVREVLNREESCIKAGPRERSCFLLWRHKRGPAPRRGSLLIALLRYPKFLRCLTAALEILTAATRSPRFIRHRRRSDRSLRRPHFFQQPARGGFALRRDPLLIASGGTRAVPRLRARVTFGRSPKSDQKGCLKPQVSRLPARLQNLFCGNAFLALRARWQQRLNVALTFFYPRCRSGCKM